MPLLQRGQRGVSMLHTDQPRNLMSSRSAAVLTLVLSLPFLFLFLTEVYDLESVIPVRDLLTSDGHQPTILGRVVMIGMLLALPVAFVVNLLSMVANGVAEQVTPFKPTNVHTFLGLSVLIVVLVTMSQPVSHELRPLVTPLGSGAIAAQLFFFLSLLVLPIAFLLNRLPRLSGRLTFRPASINLILGATILLTILMIASSFLLETLACSIGVPNCD